MQSIYNEQRLFYRQRALLRAARQRSCTQEMRDHLTHTETIAVTVPNGFENHCSKFSTELNTCARHRTHHHRGVHKRRVCTFGSRKLRSDHSSGKLFCAQMRKSHTPAANPRARPCLKRRSCQQQSMTRRKLGPQHLYARAVIQRRRSRHHAASRYAHLGKLAVRVFHPMPLVNNDVLSAHPLLYTHPPGRRQTSAPATVFSATHCPSSSYTHTSSESHCIGH